MAHFRKKKGGPAVQLTPGHARHLADASTTCQQTQETQLSFRVRSWAAQHSRGPSRPAANTPPHARHLEDALWMQHHLLQATKVGWAAPMNARGCNMSRKGPLLRWQARKTSAGQLSALTPTSRARWSCIIAEQAGAQHAQHVTHLQVVGPVADGARRVQVLGRTLQRAGRRRRRRVPVCAKRSASGGWTISLLNISTVLSSTRTPAV